MALATSLIALAESITADCNAAEGASTRMNPRMANALGRVVKERVAPTRADVRALIDACATRGWGMGKGGDASADGLERVLCGEDEAYDVERGGKLSIYGAFVLGLVQPPLAPDECDPSASHPLARSSMTTFECFLALVPPPTAPAATVDVDAPSVRAPRAKPSKPAGKCVDGVGTLRQYVRIVKVAPCYEARKFALETYVGAIDESVHLTADATEFPLRFTDLKRAFMHEPAFRSFKDDVKVAATEIYHKCKAWVVQYRRQLQAAPQAPGGPIADAGDADSEDDPMAASRKRRREATTDDDSALAPPSSPVVVAAHA